MPYKQEQTTTRHRCHASIPSHATVPNHLMPLIDEDGALHHPINEHITTITRLIDGLSHTRLTATQRYTLVALTAELTAIQGELRTLAVYNIFHGDQPINN
ncbi:MAG: hypothetical protein AB7R40_22430 [Nitrospiraceae bacterium]